MRLIDVDEVLRLLESYYVKGDEEFCETAEKIIEIIIHDVNHMPIVDAEPMRHGRWERRNDETFWWYACSVCGEPIPKKHDIEYFAPYCPNCGAIMNLEV